MKTQKWSYSHADGLPALSLLSKAPNKPDFSRNVYILDGSLPRPIGLDVSIKMCVDQDEALGYLVLTDQLLGRIIGRDSISRPFCNMVWASWFPAAYLGNVRL